MAERAAKSGLFGGPGESPRHRVLLLTTLFFLARPDSPDLQAPFRSLCHYSPPRRADVPGTEEEERGSSAGSRPRDRSPRARVPFAHPPTPTSGSAAQTWPPPPRRAAAAAAYQLSAGAGPAGSAEDRPPGGDGRGIDRLATRAAARTHTGPAPEGTSAAPGSARSRRARGLPLAAWSAPLGARPRARPPWRWGPGLREDGVLDDLPSRGVSAAHGAP